MGCLGLTLRLHGEDGDGGARVGVGDGDSDGDRDEVGNLGLQCTDAAATGENLFK